MREPEFSHAMHAWVVVGANGLITITAQIQSLWLPAIQAQLVLDRKKLPLRIPCRLLQPSS